MKKLRNERNERFDSIIEDIEAEGHNIQLGRDELLAYLDRAWRIGLLDSDLYREWMEGLHYGPPPIMSSPFLDRR